jgi:hypothetical protein
MKPEIEWWVIPFVTFWVAIALATVAQAIRRALAVPSAEATHEREEEPSWRIWLRLRLLGLLRLLDAASDLAALRSYFDRNGDGKLTAADPAFAQFKVMVTNADGSMTARTLVQLGIREISLIGDATHITLPDGSVITGQSSFTRMNGTTGTVDANGARTVVAQAYDADDDGLERLQRNSAAWTWTRTAEFADFRSSRGFWT